MHAQHFSVVPCCRLLTEFKLHQIGMNVCKQLNMFEWVIRISIKIGAYSFNNSIPQCGMS